MKGILDVPARTPESKKLKEKLLNDSKKLGLAAKEQVLKFEFKSLFGDEHEGIVITSKTGDMIKIVDKDKFTKRKEENWVYINKLMDSQNEFKKNIKQFPFDLGMWLKNWKNDITNIYFQFLDEQSKNTITITIPKKFIDTEKSIKLDFDRVDMMEKLLYNEKKSPLEIREMFLTKKIVPDNV